MAAWCWALTTVKRRDEGSVMKEMYIFSLPVQMKDEQEHSTLVMATGAAPSQPHISSQSHLVDRDSLTQSLSVPEEPLDSSSTKQCCYRESATGATGFSSCAVVMHHPRSFSPVCFFIFLEKLECFEGVGKRRCEMVADKKLCPWHGCVWIFEML